MSKLVPPSGNPKAPLWLIGEAPAGTEINQGEPFVGNAGQILRKFCMQVGIDPSECYMDNVYPYQAPGDKLSRLFRGGVPAPEVAASLNVLNDKIKRHRPNLIVTLGAIPTHLLTGKLKWSSDPEIANFTAISDWRGSILEHAGISGQKIIPTFHPSYISREGYQDHGIFIVDLQRIRRESAFAEIRRPRDSKEFIKNPRDLELRRVRERLLDADISNPVTLDIEYIGKKLLCVGLTNASNWATSIGIHSESELLICKEIIERGSPLNAQNAMFDCSILQWHYGIDAFKNLSYDTMIAAHAINIELPKDLAFLASIYNDQPNWKFMIDWDAIAAGKQSFEDLYEYNCTDVWVQHDIMEKQLSEDFADSPLSYETFMFEMALVRPLWEISERGMKIDAARKEEYRNEVVNELEFEQMGLTVLNGGNPLNVKSGDQVAEMLFDYLRIRPGGKTKTGKWKTDDKTMASLLGRAETIQQKAAIKYIRSVRQKRDLLSKFLDTELDEDGRTRGMYNPAGTGTGRLSSQKFYPTDKGHQQQNIPVRARHIIVPDDGYIFGGVDFERAESLVVAHLTGDPLMLAHHEPGVNGHRLLGALYFKKEPQDITKDEYYIMKKTRHAGNYMEGHITFMRDVNKVAHLTGVSITAKEAKEFSEWYKDVHVGLRPWWLRTRDTVYEYHELTNLLGRTRQFFQRIDQILPVAVAYVPQGTVGDLMNLGLLNLKGIVTDKTRRLYPNWEEIPAIGAELKALDFQLLNQVHDSVGFQFPPKHEGRILPLVNKCLHIPLLSPTSSESFFIGQEIKLGKSWGEASVV